MRGQGQVTPIDVLPDDVLLAIFDFCVAGDGNQSRKRAMAAADMKAWQSLVHVCRRWRSLVFQSPRRLNLQLFCTPKTPTRKTLDVWPALPLVVAGDISLSRPDNVIAALGQSNRVCQVNLDLLNKQVEEILAPIQVPFPELTYLRLFGFYDTTPVIPDSFLDGSAPHLREFELTNILFLGLPKLLLSANHLVSLRLFYMSHSEYISPEPMVALLSALSSLETLELEFKSPESCPDGDNRSLPPQKRSILPALDKFHFYGVTKYLEGFVTRIDTPQLDEMRITFFDQVDFDCPRLLQFINRTPTFQKRDKAHITFDYYQTWVKLPAGSGTLRIIISCRPDRQLSSIEQVCNSTLHPLSTVEDLHIQDSMTRGSWDDLVENPLWLQLLLPFTAVKNLHLSRYSVIGIAAVLQEFVGTRTTEVLPSLQNIFVDGFRPVERFQERFRQFAAARGNSGHPISISVRDGSQRPYWYEISD